MPINIGETIIGGASNLCGSYLTNPIWTAILIIIIMSIILVWNYWNTCKISDHVTTVLYVFVATLVILIAHSEAIKAIYDDKYKNKTSEDLVKSLTNQKEHELMTNLMQVRRANIVPQQGMTGMHQQQPQQPIGVVTQPQNQTNTQNQPNTQNQTNTQVQIPPVQLPPT